MENKFASYNPDSPADVAEYIGLLTALHAQGPVGQQKAILSAQDLNGSPLGRRLLLNVHRQISAQIPHQVDPKVLSMLLWMQKLTGQFAQGG